ncbi:recombinase family protein [Chloroflexota bacterium]
MKAAIYCRVSTEDQEREGSSLISQKEACLKKAQELGYSVSDEFIILETYSGLSLNRPKLDQLRERIRDKQVDAVIAYTLDRLSRDPVHFIILQEEIQKAGAELILVTEDIDSSDMGRLITHIRGFAAKLEAQKIRERTARGMRERLKSGKLFGGRATKLYGYTYIPGKGEGQGIRVINESEARWVKDIFAWYVKESLSIYSITLRLRELSVPAPGGNITWSKAAVHDLLRNPAYTGKTMYNDIEIPGVTPPIINEDTFLRVQTRFKQNRLLSLRNTKRQYLLSGYLFCKTCGRRYGGFSREKQGKNGLTEHRYYRCPNRGGGNLLLAKCDNSIWNADKLEALVRNEIERVLSEPELIFAEVERRKGQNQTELFELEIMSLKDNLNKVDKDQAKLLQLAMADFPKTMVDAENKRYNQYRTELLQRLAEAEARVTQAQQLQITLDNVERYCRVARENLATFTYEAQRLALEALQVEISLDSNKVLLKGIIPTPKLSVASSSLSPGNTSPNR